MSSNFYAFLNRMKYIDRWALMRNSQSESLSTHSFEVAAVCYCLGSIGNRRFGRDYDLNRAAVLGLFHDCNEILTGDMPTPVKYFSETMKSAYDEVEAAAAQKLLSTVPDDLQDDFAPLLVRADDDRKYEKIIKAADKISALIKCIEERRAGNSDFLKAEESSRASILKLDCDEANTFLEEFLPSFELTLDQLT